MEQPNDNDHNNQDLNGYSVIRNADNHAIVKISTRDIPDVKRWKVMPPLNQKEFASLTVLELHKSRYLTTLHPSIGQLTNLRELLLTRCEKL